MIKRRRRNKSQQRVRKLQRKRKKNKHSFIDQKLLLLHQVDQLNQVNQLQQSLSKASRLPNKLLQKRKNKSHLGRKDQQEELKSKQRRTKLRRLRHPVRHLRPLNPKLKHQHLKRPLKIQPKQLQLKLKIRKKHLNKSQLPRTLM